MKIAAEELKTERSSNVPTLTIMDVGREGLIVPIAVPQFGQKKRFTGFSKSEREKWDGVPFVYLKSS